MLDRLERRFTLEDPNTPLGDGFTVMDLFGGGQSATGKRVGDDQALHVSAFYAGVNVIASAIGSLPLKVYRRRDDGGKDEQRDHPLWEILQVEPNPEMSATPYREATQGHLLLRGNGYSEIVRDGRGRPRALWPIPPQAVTVKRLRGGELVYEVRVAGDLLRLPPERMLHIPGLGGDGISGWSVVRLARESLALGIASEEYGARFFSNNARPSGLLVHPASLGDDAAKRLKARWEAAQGGLSNAHRVAVLEEGVQWQQMGLSAEDSQFLQTRKFQVTEIARWLNIQPHKIGDLERSTNNNIEHQGIEFVQDTLMPWAKRWEQTINSRLLTPSERRTGLFVEFQMQGLLRADSEKRATYLRERFNTGSITPNEIRSHENENPLPGGDEAFIQLNMVPLSTALGMTAEERSNLLLAAAGVPVETRAAPVETRSPQHRLRIRGAFKPLLRDASERMVRGELRNVRKAAKRILPDTNRFTEWLVEFYFREHPEFAKSTLGPVMSSYADAMAAATIDETNAAEVPTLTAFVDSYIDTFVQRYAASSRGQLQAVMEDDGEPADLVEARLSEWEEGTDTSPRHERVANRASTELGNAIANQVFVAAGVVLLVSRTLGEDCPYCQGIDGRTVAVGEPFFREGDTFQPDGASSPLTFKQVTKYPPYHPGCDCYIAPA